MAFTTQVITDAHRKYIAKFTGSAIETNSLLVDTSLLNYYDTVTPPRVEIVSCWWSIESTNSVKLLWDATANVEVFTMTSNGLYSYFSGMPSLKNNSGAGITGDILITTTAATNFSLIIELNKTEGYPQA